MAKVFTITPGLENMGALKTGGQGSVYKGRRIGEVITAIKLLPTPIYSESEDDKNYRDFQNEVQKLTRVNQEPNPNVVKIISYGLSETGNFPYIEMDYIEGPDLEELLKPPHNPVFTIKEVIKVAEQLSNALAHCHKQDVKHGDVKSNNVKYNIHTGNYVLLDFGLAIMSDEQRRTSLRHAGAVEFMAPEQNEGLMLFQTDVYSFGVVMFELLTGQVPFPLVDKGETARNIVRLSHLETPPPDVISLRREMLPAGWPQEKRDQEMLVPEWLINLVYKCLKKKPENRFGNGVELYEYVIYNSTHAVPPRQQGEALLLKAESEKLSREKTQLQQQLNYYRDQLTEKEREIDELRQTVSDKDSEVEFMKKRKTSGGKGVSKSAFFALLLLTVALAAFSAYSYLKNSAQNKQEVTKTPADKPDNEAIASHPVKKKPVQKKRDSSVQKTKLVTVDTTVNNAGRSSENTRPQTEAATQPNSTDNNLPDNGGVSNSGDNENVSNASGKYTVISKAYFYNGPDETTKRNAFIVHWNNAVLTPSDEMNGFVYVTYTNADGQTSRGWLRKKDLKLLNK